MNSKVFGYERIYFFQAEKKFKQGLNIFVLFYYHDFDSSTLIESPICFLGKSLPSHLPAFTDSYRKHLLSLNENLGSAPLISKSTFGVLLDHVLMKNVFPHRLIETFYYTDNKTVVPKEFLRQIIEEPKHKQLTMF